MVHKIGRCACLFVAASGAFLTVLYGCSTVCATEKICQKVIRSSCATYQVNVDGNLDEFNTRRFTGHYECGFQPNISVTITNSGDVEVINPRITINGRRNWFSIQDILAEIIKPGMTDEEKTLAVWDWCRNNISTGPGGGGIVYGKDASVVAFINTVGVGACGTFHSAMPHLAKAAGVEAEAGVLADGSHAVQREIWNGKDHYLDCMIPATTGEQPKGHFALSYDNKTVASTAECDEDRYLMDRAAPGDYLNAVLHGPGSHFWPIKDDWRDVHVMGYVLRPGESITREWKPIGKGWQGENLKSNARGWFKYDVKLSKDQISKYARSDNLAFSDDGVYPQEQDRPAYLVYRMASPYVLIGGKVSLQYKSPSADRGLLSIQYRLDGRGGDWETLWESDSAGQASAEISLPDSEAFHEGSPTYSFEVKINIRSTCMLQKLALQADFQTYIPSLPSLSAGKNLVRYVDDTTGPHEVTITHRWIEKSGRVPSAPVLKWPKGGVTAPFNTVFQWTPPPNVEADAYEFYLSARPDMAWPLLGTFDCVIYSSKPEFSAVTPDAFNDGQTYYWRVRARSKDGVWGPWSSIASFVARGPGMPVDPRLDCRPDGRIILNWNPPKNGTSAVKYEIYGCDEPSFSPLRKAISQPAWACKSPVSRRPNLLLSTSRLSLDVTNRSESFYRIVAVDKFGARSLPTRVIEIPHPTLMPSSPIQARVNSPMSFNVPIRRSIGKAVFALKGGLIRKNPDQFTTELVEGPKWLTIEPTTGTVGGTPSKPGEYRFVIRLVEPTGASSEKEYIIIAR